MSRVIVLRKEKKEARKDVMKHDGDESVAGLRAMLALDLDGTYERLVL